MKRDEVRRVDQVAIQQYGISGLVLMENAGRGATDIIAARLAKDRTIRLLCGAGNNGGDGFVIARHLELLGYRVAVITLAEESRTADAQTNLAILRRAEIPVAWAQSRSDLEASLTEGDPIVDCLLGTGATGDPRGLYKDAIEIANARTGARIAIDIPTGLDCDSGEPSAVTFRADFTITFVDRKDGFENPAARPWTGDVEVVGIGAPRHLLQQFGIR